jgi:hypothetical protein
MDRHGRLPILFKADDGGNYSRCDLAVGTIPDISVPPVALRETPPTEENSPGTWSQMEEAKGLGRPSYPPIPRWPPRPCAGPSWRNTFFKDIGEIANSAISFFSLELTVQFTMLGEPQQAHAKSLILLAARSQTVSRIIIL